MRVRPLLGVVIAAVAAAAGTSAQAASAPASAQVVDVGSDANFLNDNAPVAGTPNHPTNHNPTPAGSEPAADILAIEWKTLKAKGSVTGFTVTMFLSGAPTKSGILYRATSESTDCSTLWFQYFSADPGSTPQGSLRNDCDGTKIVAIPTKVVDNSIVWTFEFSNKDLPTQVKKGVEITGMGGHSRPFAALPTCVNTTSCSVNPLQYDVTDNIADKPYKVGS